MAGKRIKDVVSQQTTFDPDLKILVDHDSFALTAKAMRLGLLGNTRIQGSVDGVNYHDNITSDDTTLRISTNGGVSWISLNTDVIPESASRLYLTPELTLELEELINLKHEHSNLSVLNSIISSGDGTNFLSDDGTYKKAMLTDVYDTDDNGVVDNSERLGNQLPNHYLSRENHIGVIHNNIKGLTVSYPTDAENIVMFYTDVDITIVDINAVVKGIAPSIRVDFTHTTDITLSGTSILANPTDVTNTTVGQSLPLNQVNVPANSWISFKTSLKTGSVNGICVSISYDIN